MIRERVTLLDATDGNHLHSKQIVQITKDGVRLALLSLLALLLLTALFRYFVDHPIVESQADLILWTATVVVLLSLSLSYTDRFADHLPIYVVSGTILSTLLLLWLWQVSAWHDVGIVYAAISLILIWNYTLSHLSFRVAMAVGWLLTLVSLSLVTAFSQTVDGTYSYGILFLIIVNLFGMTSCLNNERAAEQLMEIVDSLHQTASIDEMTGVFTRRHFFELTAREYSRALRCKTPFSLLLIDIDHFKLINDEYGHPMGDQVLRRLTECMMQNLREIDICGRFGGDEFIVLLQESTPAAAMTTAERILHCVRSQTVTSGEEQVGFSVSIGIHGVIRLLPNECYSLEQLIHHADTALYAAKRKGRGCACYSDG